MTEKTECGSTIIRNHKTGKILTYVEGPYYAVWSADWYNITRGEGRILLMRGHRYINNPKNKYANIRTSFR